MSQRLLLPKRILCPDEFLLERSRRSPEFGPRMLFFSGGSSLKELSKELINYTHNSIHMITPFDSGGSSMEIRRNFAMPAVGDFRNRMMALADTAVRANPGVLNFFSYRLSKALPNEDLQAELESMIAGSHQLVRAIDGPLRRIITSFLRIFYENMPSTFNLQGASIGNLIIVGGYLTNDRHLDSILYLFRKLVEVRGIVRPVSTENLHLVAELEDGTELRGQHLITQTSQKIRRLWLGELKPGEKEAEVAIKEKVYEQISDAELICYPYGSFYTSLLACLLPDGVGEAIASNRCAKIYIPNLKGDCEQTGMTIAEEVQRILQYGGSFPAEQLLNAVILDESDESYDRNIDIDEVERFGVSVLRFPLLKSGKWDYEKLISLLLTMTG